MGGFDCICRRDQRVLHVIKHFVSCSVEVHACAVNARVSNFAHSSTNVKLRTCSAESTLVSFHGNACARLIVQTPLMLKRSFSSSQD